VIRLALAGALALCGLIAAVASGCGVGDPVTETRMVGDYQRLEVEGSLDLDVRLFNRPDPGLRITAGEKTIDRIRTEVDGDTLRISTKSEGIVIGPNPVGDVSVSLGVPALAGLEVIGDSSVALSGLSAKTLELRINGSGAITARGRVDELEVEIDGSGDTNLAQLAAQTAQVRTDGSGQVDLRVSEVLDIVSEGSGDILYRGRPRITSRIEGSGDVRQVGG
jgi:Putative auto-transporter adhesin, head GIN domain